MPSGFACAPRRIPWSVPVGPAVVLERGEPFANEAQASADVGDGERRPVREVAFGRGAVPGEVAKGELTERVLPVRPTGFRHAIGEQRVRVLVPVRTTAADEKVQLE